MDRIRRPYGKGIGEVGVLEDEHEHAQLPTTWSQGPFKRARDEGEPGRVSVARICAPRMSEGGLSVGSPRYTDIPLSPYRPSVDFHAEPKAAGSWNGVYLHLGKI